MRAYQAAGITIPRVTYQQWRTGTRLPQGHEQPGDLVFMNMNPSGPGHVGIVTGNGAMIHAPHAGDIVRTANYKTRNDIVGFVHIGDGLSSNL